MVPLPSAGRPGENGGHDNSSFFHNPSGTFFTCSRQITSVRSSSRMRVLAHLSILAATPTGEIVGFVD
jgi:hypothetical protein